MRKKDLRVVGKPSAEKHCVLLDPRVKPEDDTFMKETEDDERSETGILRKHPKPRWGFGVREAMNLVKSKDAPSSEGRNIGGIGNERECAPAHETRNIGGIGESRRADTESGCSPIPSFPYSSLSSFPRKRESRGRDSESGRSMVETLGVLAIMGLLAVGGIMAYRYAVDKYNANEIINEVKKRAIVASQ